MATSKVKVTIGGSEYSLVTDDDVEYIEELAKVADRKFQKFMSASPSLSQTQCAVLVALDFADEGKKATKTADKLRSQIKDYLDDASNAKSKADWARHELEEVKKQLDKLKKENERLKAQLKKQTSGSDNG